MTGNRSKWASCSGPACALLAAVALASPTAAQSVAEFYKGKTVTLIVGSGASGGDDTFARIFAKYVPRHLPGSPSIVVQNQPGAGGVLAAANMYNTASRDGTVFGSVLRGVPTTPLLSDIPVNFDSRRLNWLGSLSKETNVIIVWHTAAAKSFEDLLHRETIVGTTGGGSDSNVYPLLFNQTLGTKFKVIGGYPGGPDIDLAIQRGELEGRASHTWTALKGARSDWLKENKIRILAQMGMKRNPELPNVPNVLEYVKDQQARDVYEFLLSRQEASRPFVAPPDLPPERLTALRKVLADVTRDPEFGAEIEKTGGTVDLMPGEDLQKLVDHAYSLPPDVIGRVRVALNPPK